MRDIYRSANVILDESDILEPYARGSRYDWSEIALAAYERWSIHKEALAIWTHTSRRYDEKAKVFMKRFCK
jgi:hypothetical protein